MSYLNEFEQELKGKLLSAETDESIIRWVTEKLLQSYRDGVRSGQRATVRIERGKSRPQGSFPAEA